MPILALVGATATGKTEIAIEVARRFGAEIIGADSRQVYRGLDIGSAKPTREQRAAVPHHLVDVVDPDGHFDCAIFRDLSLGAVRDIEARGRRVLVVGGTGLYIKVLRGGIFAGPPRDPALRARLIDEEEASPGTLHRRLGRVDAATAARLHARDRVRLVRALEVFELTGRPISAWQAEHRFAETPLDLRVVALDVPREEIYRRIGVRARAMVDAGLVEEVRGLLEAGYSSELASMRSPGYAEMVAHLRGHCSLEEAVERISQSTRHLAKRQLTWLRGHPPDLALPPRPEAVMRAAADVWG